MVSAGGDGHIRLDPEDDRVARVTINQPAKLSASTSSIVAELASVVEQVNKDKGVRTVTLTGNGRAFFVSAVTSQSWAPTRARGNSANA